AVAADRRQPGHRGALPRERPRGRRPDRGPDANPARAHERRDRTRGRARGARGAAAHARGRLPRARRSGARMSLLSHQLRTEQLVFWRNRESAVFIFIFPLLLYLLLGSVYNGRIEGHPAADALLAGLLGYGAANTAFAGIAITLVIRRESGLLKRLRATPLPPALYLTASVTSILVVFTLQTITLFAIGRIAFGAPLPHNAASVAML